MPAHQLWLKVPRNVVLERGYGVQHKPGDVEAELVRGNWSIDPLTGFLCPIVTWSAADPLTFTLTGTEATDYVEGLVPNSTQPWTVHSTSDEFTATTTADLLAGHGFFFTFLIYEDAGPTIEVTFGGGFKLVLEEGVGELKKVGATAAEDETIAFEIFWPQDEWFTKPHTLYIYNIGTYVAVRRVGDAVKSTGLIAFDKAAESRTPKFALQAAPVAITSTGHVAVFISPERHATTLSCLHQRIRMQEDSTQAPEATLRRILPNVTGEENPPAEPTITVLDGDGSALPETTDEFSYLIEATLLSATSPNLYITSARVYFPALSGSDGLTAVDLNALSGVAVQRVTEHLSLADTDGQIGFEVIANSGTLSPYVQANMLGSWKPEGTLRAAFLTDKPNLTFPSRTLERLVFGASTRWKSFETQKWTGSESYSGKLLATAYRDVAKRAGLDTSEITIYTGGYKLPEPDDDDDEGIEFRSDQSLADIMNYLREQFGANDLTRFRPDGKFYAEAMPTAASGITFYWSTPGAQIPAILAGTTTYPRIYKDSWDEVISEDGLANEVFVIGADKQKKPLVSFATDWSSINDPTVWNFVGEFRRMVIIDPALMDQATVNWVCRQVWERVRKLRVFARFEAMYVASLIPGMIVTVDGRSNWRLLSMDTEWVQEQKQGLSTYEAELVQ